MATDTPTLLDMLLAATPEQLDAVYAILSGETVTPDPDVTMDTMAAERWAESPQDTDTLLGTTMVTVYGPNLSAKAQRLGDLHVHTTGCQSGKQYGTGRPMGGDDDGGWTIDAASKMDVTLDCYPPGDFEYDPSIAADYMGYRQSIYFAPCVTLPEA